MAATARGAAAHTPFRLLRLGVRRLEGAKDSLILSTISDKEREGVGVKVQAQRPERLRHASSPVPAEARGQLYGAGTTTKEPTAAAVAIAAHVRSRVDLVLMLLVLAALPGVLRVADQSAGGNELKVSLEPEVRLEFAVDGCVHGHFDRGHRRRATGLVRAWARVPQDHLKTAAKNRRKQ